MANRPRSRVQLWLAAGLSAVLASLAVLLVSADFSGEEWRFFKPIVLPAGHDQEFLVEIVPEQLDSVIRMARESFPESPVAWERDLLGHARLVIVGATRSSTAVGES